MNLTKQRRGQFRLDRNSAFSHAYILWGGSEAEQDEFAWKPAAAIVCANLTKTVLGMSPLSKAACRIHPDIIVLDRNPEAREIYVDQIRASEKTPSSFL